MTLVSPYLLRRSTCGKPHPTLNPLAAMPGALGVQGQERGCRMGRGMGWGKGFGMGEGGTGQELWVQEGKGGGGHGGAAEPLSFPAPVAPASASRRNTPHFQGAAQAKQLPEGCRVSASGVPGMEENCVCVGGGVKHEREAWTSPVLTRVCTHVGLEMPSHHTRRYTLPRGGRRARLIHNAPSVNSWPSQVRREDSRDAAWRLQAGATIRKGASTAPLTTGLLPPEDSVQHLGTCRRRAA